ncbi:MAG TPA: heavy metal translocating P-type ATPase [Arenicellales bacterium]|jgi:Cu+-exporting ATPase|nr:heavy metal translocating P-type ATPase [Pseudomonadales bacterium]MDP6316424.1 heavy metal translocating P-type ATPase [Pseudomonadales bacterium]MDP7316431.1 heavy metal translocating P-type ATPase [Pseudomonadales bacterium]HJL53708.1 heavy metal translocating P-type ATPase [Arenicellales bacterium]HJP50409.1 heavy metal translocating P-type ATPase [Pseudomonadales bacterium]|tara:strand:+ start:2060 stop:4246 length:2187 start_codon:yes stop_codon:yes gene_type:complete
MTSSAGNALPGDTYYNLQIQGMSCAGCVASVERTLKNVPGVSDAVVNLPSESAYVEGSCDLKDLLAAVDKAGYSATVSDPDNIDEKETLLKAELYQRLWKSGVALVGGSLLMGGMALNLFPSIENQLFWIVVGLLVLIGMVVAGGHFFRGAFHSARYLSTTMDTLIALGTGTAWTYSMLVVLLPSVIPEASQHLFFEAALFIIGFVNLGKSLEMNARGKVSGAIEKLLTLTPDETTVVADGEEQSVAVWKVGIGDLLRIKPGDRLPVDGVITEGFSSIDESMLTGEPVSVDKTAGDRVAAGTINLFGTFTMQAEQIGDETTLARMVSLVKDAQNSKPPIGRIADSIAAVFVPAVLVIAALCIVYWGWLAAESEVSLVIVTAMSVLIVACPCALGLAIPMSVMVGVTRAATNGLLIRNSDALQAAIGIDTIVLDKTGTLTEGKPKVVSVSSEESSLLNIAYSLESSSEHPLATAIIDYCITRGVKKLPVTSFQISPGGGVSANVSGKDAVIGNAKFLKSQGVIVGGDEIGTTIYVAEDGLLIGSFVLADTLKDEAENTVLQLQRMGIEVLILSGDNQSSVGDVAKDLGISNFKAGLSPEDKLAEIRSLQQEGKKVAMVGDGINDAPALGIADVGFAMGEGTDIAIESADIAIVGNQLNKVVSAIRISKRTIRNIYQNLFGAFVYNIILIPIAAGVLYPILISPTFAGMAMAMSSVTVVANASRLRFIAL